MTLSSEIIAVQNLQARNAVGYGIAGARRKRGVLASLPAAMLMATPGWRQPVCAVLVDGVRTATVGRISMDMLAVDLLHALEAGIGAPIDCGAKRLKSTMSRPRAAPSAMVNVRTGIRVPVVTV